MADDTTTPKGEEEVAAEATPAAEAPAEVSAVEEATAEPAVEETPVQAVAEDAAADETSAEEAPVAEAADEESPADAPAEQPVAAADEEPAAEAPVERAVPARPIRTDGRPVAISIGRRKSSRARVRLFDGAGAFVLNGRNLESYFPSMANRIKITEPLRVTGMEGRFDVHAKLEGGGSTGQTGALQLAIARALVEVNPELRPELKRAGLLTRDARRVERKKYGLRKARRAPQFTKR